MSNEPGSRGPSLLAFPQGIMSKKNFWGQQKTRNQSGLRPNWFRAKFFGDVGAFPRKPPTPILLETAEDAVFENLDLVIEETGVVAGVAQNIVGHLGAQASAAMGDDFLVLGHFLESSA